MFITFFSKGLGSRSPFCPCTDIRLCRQAFSNYLKTCLHRTLLMAWVLIISLHLGDNMQPNGQWDCISQEALGLPGHIKQLLFFKSEAMPEIGHGAFKQVLCPEKQNTGVSKGIYILPGELLANAGSWSPEKSKLGISSKWQSRDLGGAVVFH